MILHRIAAPDVRTKSKRCGEAVVSFGIAGQDFDVLCVRNLRVLQCVATQRMKDIFQRRLMEENRVHFEVDCESFRRTRTIKSGKNIKITAECCVMMLFSNGMKVSMLGMMNPKTIAGSTAWPSLGKM